MEVEFFDKELRTNINRIIEEPKIDINKPLIFLDQSAKLSTDELDKCFKLLQENNEDVADQITKILHENKIFPTIEKNNSVIDKDNNNWFFYQLMYCYVNASTDTIRNITSDCDVISVSQGSALNSKSVFALDTDGQIKYNKYTKEYQELQSKFLIYNNAINSFSSIEANKTYLDFYEKEGKPLLWYMMVNNGDEFFKIETILKIIDNTSSDILNAKVKKQNIINDEVKEQSLFDFIVDQKIGGGKDLSDIIRKLVDQGVKVNQEDSEILNELLTGHRMKSSNITSTLCIENAKKGDVDLVYTLLKESNKNPLVLSVVREIGRFIESCEDGERLNKLLCSVLRNINYHKQELLKDSLFQCLNKQGIFDKIKITPEALYEIINLEPNNKLLFDSAVSNILNQIKKDTNNPREQQELISKILETKCDDNGLTPFLLACKKGWDNAIKKLIKLDPLCVNQKDKNGQNSLEMAVDYGLVETATLLIEGRVATTKEAFISAVKGNQETMVKLLLKNKANPNWYGKIENTNEQEVESKSIEDQIKNEIILNSNLKNLSTPEILFKKESKINEDLQDNIEILDKIELTPKLNYKINLIPTIKNISALEIAVKNNNFKMVSILVGAGASVRDNNNKNFEFYSDYKKSLQPNQKKELLEQEFEAFTTYVGKTVVDIDKIIGKSKESISNSKEPIFNPSEKNSILDGMERLREEFFNSVVKNEKTHISDSLNKINSIMHELSCGKVLLGINNKESPFKEKDLGLLKQGKFSETSVLKPTNTPQPNKLLSSIVDSKSGLFK